ncbi:hypothetical protein OE88DRAFT_1724235 [Heliocybe sulcata]|uniref:F-box domain-containing protein n=1 Tax=Heliocybe sulcata TaxID=5364 RepID=A0A5C3N957_9AGAM|nr:hypothetical protein OE88DRAFT_1724235 [Heliocybe sulcata]
MSPSGRFHSFLHRFFKERVNKQGALPIEVVENIFAYVAPSPPEPDTKSSYKPYPGRAARAAEKEARAREQAWFASMLLVCSRWYSAGTPLLYRNVQVSSPEQLHKLAKTLRRRSKYGAFVERLSLPHQTSSVWPFKSVRSGYAYRDDVTAVFSACKFVQHVDMEPPAWFDPPPEWHVVDKATGKPKLDVSAIPAPRDMWPEAFMHLKSLKLHGGFITKTFLAHPGSLPSLEELFLVGTTRPDDIESKNYMTVGRHQVRFDMPNLRVLRLRRCIVDISWLYRDSYEWPKLETLDVAYCSRTEVNADRLYDVTTRAETLQTLQIHWSTASLLLYGWVHQYPRLKTLVVLLDRGFPCIPAELSNISNLDCLELVILEYQPGERVGREKCKGSGT